MGLKVLITGVNGFIGRNLLNRIAGRHDLEVTGVDLQETMNFHNGTLPHHFTYRSADLDDSVSVEQLGTVCRYDTIVHLAGVLAKDDDPGTRNRILEANVGVVLRVLDLARSHKAHFIFPSTGLIYGNHEGPFRESTAIEPAGFYALSKLLAEELINNFCRENALDWTVFRIAVLYGPGQTGSMFIPSLVNALLNGREFPMTKGEQARDFLYIDDLVTAFEIAIERRAKGLFNLGTGIPVRLAEVARMVEKQTGINGLLRIGALPYRNSESWTYCLSSDKIYRKCGWSPRTSLEEGLRKVINYEREFLEAQIAMNIPGGENITNTAVPESTGTQ